MVWGLGYRGWGTGFHSHLETPHVPWVPCVLQTVLVALQEELEEEPAETTRELCEWNRVCLRRASVRTHPGANTFVAFVQEIPQLFRSFQELLNSITLNLGCSGSSSIKTHTQTHTHTHIRQRVANYGAM